MTKYVDFTWKVPVPQELLDGTVADKWVEEKDSADLEHEAFFRSVKCCFFHDLEATKPSYMKFLSKRPGFCLKSFKTRKW